MVHSLGGVRLKTLLHSLQVLKIVGILTQAPSHDTTKVLLRNNFRELAGNHRGGIPGPENVVIAVEVVLTTAHLVGLAVLLSFAP